MWSDDAFEDEPVNWKRRLARAAIGVAVFGSLCAAIWFIAANMPKTERHAIQTVTRITLPPPPVIKPPPPKPPEPEKVVETPKIQEPKLADKKPDKAPPKPRAPPAAPLTAEAGAGANPYGLAVGNGSGNVIGGGGEGDAKLAYLSYGRTVSADVQAALRRDDRLRFAKFTLELRIWLDAAGKVVRVQLASSSGDPGVDDAVTHTLGALAMPEPPPKDMPQPIRLRTKSAPG